MQIWIVLIKLKYTNLRTTPQEPGIKQMHAYVY
jgi:hypothetical protein